MHFSNLTNLYVLYVYISLPNTDVEMDIYLRI